MPNPRKVIDTIALRFSDNEVLQRVAERLDDGSMAFKVDIIGGLSLTVGDIDIGAVHILNDADAEINPATEETLEAVLAAVNGTNGAPQNHYAEETGVVAGAPTDLVSFAVPAGKTFFLRHATASGDVIAQYWVEIDGVKQASKRSYFTDYNVDFFFESDQGQGLSVAAGSVVKIVGLHSRPTTGNFEANFFGRLV